MQEPVGYRISINELFDSPPKTEVVYNNNPVDYYNPSTAGSIQDENYAYITEYSKPTVFLQKYWIRLLAALCLLVMLVAVPIIVFLVVPAILHHSRSEPIPPIYTCANQKCFQIMKTPKNWSDAKNSCSKYPNSNLISIKSARENENMQKLMAKFNLTRIWLGLHCDETEISQCEWLSGGEYSYNSQNPTLGECTFLTNSKWQSSDCMTTVLPFICEMSQAKEFMKPSTTEKP
ncbi:unnamed protein product [Caenorhabditis nigoni]